MSKRVRDILGRGQRGFTLIELLAVMAILAVLVAVVAPSVTGTRDASINAQVMQDATQVRSAATKYFSSIKESEVRTPHTVTPTTELAGMTAGVTSAVQKVSDHWPEMYITTANAGSFPAGYAQVFQTTPDPVVKEVVLLNEDGEGIGGSALLTRFTAIDMAKLMAEKLLEKEPDGFESESDGAPNFLWLFQKTSSSAAAENKDDSRVVAVFKLVKVEKLEGQTTAGGEQKVRLTYKQIFGTAVENQTPTAQNASVTTSEDTPVAITLTGFDVEGDTLTFAGITAPSHGSLSGTAPNFTYIPGGNYYGPDSFTFRVSDGARLSAAGTISITVTPVNDAPVAAGVGYAVAEGGALNAGAPGALTNDSDADGDSLTAVGVSGPNHAANFALNFDGSFTYTHDGSETTSDHFVYQAFDGFAYSAIVAWVSIEVTPVNDAPVANFQTVTTSQGTSVVITLTGSDVEGDTLTFAVITEPIHGTLTLNSDGSFTYTPEVGYVGADSFTYEAFDGLAYSNVATVSLNVT